MRKINEIFYSLQGEGINAGIPSVFIRFSGCNLRCNFCDTSHEKGRFMTDDEIIKEVRKYPAPMIVLTGGEPSLFIDEEFISRLKEETCKMVAIETNGTFPLPSGIDWITVSPKCGMRDKVSVGGKENLSEAGSEDLEETVPLIPYADEVKVVDIGQDLDQYFMLECVSHTTEMLLQPCYTADPSEREKNTHRTVQRVLKDPRWRLSLQTHRYLDIR